MKILIVDDVPTNLRLLRAVLEGQNFEVLEASDGVEGLAVLENQQVDAIISDILMPNMDGYRFCEEVRRNERLFRLPFIVYTSTYMSPTDEKVALDMGADKYMKKPAPISVILEALNEIIIRRRTSQPRAVAPQQELSRSKLYNETLVNKLEQRNQELSDQTEALVASEEKFRQLAENISEVLWITTADGSKLLYVSPSYEVVWGRTCQSLYDNPLSSIEAIHEADRGFMIAAMSELMRGEKFDLEFRVLRPDGQLRWVHARGGAVRDESGAICRLVGIYENITRRKEAELQLRHAQKLESLGQLASGVAHDFNNLLAIIGGNLELLVMTEKNLGIQSKDYVAHIAHAADRAATLNRQLLSFSRSEVGEMRLLDLNELTISFTKMLRRIVGENIRVENACAPKLPPINGDPGMIEQVLMNLAVNARDAMPNGGQLVIGTEIVVIDEALTSHNPHMRVGRHACLSVRDNGVGIAAEVLPRIFEPFYTTKGEGKGTGLGLATVFGVADQHKGWVDVSSQVGLGTTFRVFFPVSTEAMPVTSLGVAKKPRGGAETILLVEDERSVRNVVVQTLENYGYTIVEADSGASAEGIWTQQKGQIDLLITDMVMPGRITGLELIELLRRKKPGLKAMLMSGYSRELAGAGPAMEMGISFVQKPFLGKVLAEAVRKCLDSDSPPMNAHGAMPMGGKFTLETAQTPYGEHAREKGAGIA